MTITGLQHLLAISCLLNPLVSCSPSGITSSLAAQLNNKIAQSPPATLELTGQTLVEQKKIEVDVNSMLLKAAYNSSLSVVQFALEQESANVNALNSYYETPLHMAISRNHLDVVEYLLGRHANIYYASSYQLPAPQLAAANGYLDVVKLLIEKHGVSVDWSDSYYFPQTMLCYATENGHLQVVEYLLEKGASVSARGINSQYPLHKAVLSGQLAIVEAIAKKDSLYVNVADPYGRTPLHYAYIAGYTDIIEFLESSGANDPGIFISQ